ncbi:MAG: hypothetical protein AB1491_05805 [Thermodesulfobacteriota bacterium]
MFVTINEENIPADFSHLRNLEDVIVELNEKFIPQGQQLFQVHINGEFFSERYPRESRYMDLRDIATLSLKTISDEDMARIILKDAIGQADLLAQAMEQSATLFRLAAEDEANQYFAQVLDALRWFLQTSDKACQVLKLELNLGNSPQTALVPDFLAKLQNLLQEMMQVCEEEDYILLADLMEYELLPMVQTWQKLLSQIACN